VTTMPPRVWMLWKAHTLSFPPKVIIHTCHLDMSLRSASISIPPLIMPVLLLLSLLLCATTANPALLICCLDYSDALFDFDGDGADSEENYPEEDQRDRPAQ